VSAALADRCGANFCPLEAEPQLPCLLLNSEARRRVLSHTSKISKLNFGNKIETSKTSEYIFGNRKLVDSIPNSKLFPQCEGSLKGKNENLNIRENRTTCSHDFAHEIRSHNSLSKFENTFVRENLTTYSHDFSHEMFSNSKSNSFRCLDSVSPKIEKQTLVLGTFAHSCNSRHCNGVNINLKTNSSPIYTKVEVWPSSCRHSPGIDIECSRSACLPKTTLIKQGSQVDSVQPLWSLGPTRPAPEPPSAPVSNQPDLCSSPEQSHDDGFFGPGSGSILPLSEEHHRCSESRKGLPPSSPKSHPGLCIDQENPKPQTLNKPLNKFVNPNSKQTRVETDPPKGHRRNIYRHLPSRNIYRHLPSGGGPPD